MIANIPTGLGGSLPKGVIVMWSGAETEVPGGWHVCDGTNGTPNLRGKFVLSSSSSRSIGTTGGEETHRLTTSEMPSHAHSGTTNTATATHSHGYNYNSYKSTSVVPGTGYNWKEVMGVSYDFTGRSTGEANTSHSHTVSVNSSGGSTSHNNMPPYYVLAYIMKL